VNPWIEKLRAAETKVERDQILLWEWRELGRWASLTTQEIRLYQEIEEQLRALADEAFPTVL
jgi:hypothetical protein